MKIIIMKKQFGVERSNIIKTRYDRHPEEKRKYDANVFDEHRRVLSDK